MAWSPLHSLGNVAVASVVVLVAVMLLVVAAVTAPDRRSPEGAAGSLPYRLAEPDEWSRTPPNGLLVERDRYQQVVGVWGCPFFDDFSSYKRVHGPESEGELRVGSVAAPAQVTAVAEAEGSCGYIDVYPVPPPVEVAASGAGAWQCASDPDTGLLNRGLWLSSKLNLRLVYTEPFERGDCDFLDLPAVPGRRGEPTHAALTSASTRLANYLTVLEQSPQTRDSAILPRCWRTSFPPLALPRRQWS